jgi:hypothetical protein
MARPALRGPAVLGFALVVLQVSSWPAFAECGNLLAEVVKPGDVISVTPWSGGKHTGQATAITDCSLVIRTAKGLIDVPIETIKTVRRHQRAASEDAEALLNVANDCRGVSCARATLAFVGIAAVVRGFDRLVHPPKVVYRAKKKSVATAVPACPSTSRADRTGT